MALTGSANGSRGLWRPLKDTYSIALQVGEVFTAELLKEAYENSTMPYEHEHVTPYMYYTNTSKGAFPYERDESAYRLTLDTPEDYEVIRLVYDALYQPGNTFTLDEMIAYLDEHPEILAINSHIQQKK